MWKLLSISLTPPKIRQLAEIQADVPFYSQVNKLKRRGENGKNFILLWLISFKSIIFNSFPDLSFSFLCLQPFDFPLLFLVSFNHLPTMLLMITRLFFSTLSILLFCPLNLSLSQCCVFVQGCDALSTKNQLQYKVDHCTHIPCVLILLVLKVQFRWL